MVSKTFEQVLRFHRFQTPKGSVWLPLITIELIYGEGNRLAIPVIFDTGATTTTLRAEFAPFLGATTWTDGEPVSVATAGGEITAYRFIARLEVLGKVLECPVDLQELPWSEWYHGLLGREAVFEHFGFGFWEKDHELLITASP